MQNKNLRVFIGPSEVANIGTLLAMGLRERKVKVTVACRLIFPHQEGMKYDIIVGDQGKNKLQKLFIYLRLFLRVCFQHNAFIFLAGNSLLPYNLDLPLLKLMGKTIVVNFVGCDIRHYLPYEEWLHRNGVQKYSLCMACETRNACNLEHKLKIARRFERYATYLAAQPGYAQLLKREYKQLYIPIDCSQLKCNTMPNPRPIVVHAPSNISKKGTTYILDAVERLKREGYDFDFRLFQEMSNLEVRRALEEADIAVDQLLSTGTGMFGMEAMATGCAVLGRVYPDIAGFPPELPVLNTDPDTIYQNLKMLLENPELRRELGGKGRRYVEKYHDYLKVADDFLELTT